MNARGRWLVSMLVPTLMSVALGCGLDSTAPAPPPEAPRADAAGAATVLAFNQVSPGLDHTCGVTTDGRAWCWGYSQWGQLGNGVNNGPDECNTHPCSNRPAAVSGGLRFRHVNVGWQLTCGATTDDRIYCWGRNDAGQLGTGGGDPVSLVPVQVAGGIQWRQARAGNAFACGIASDRAAYCWGLNSDGQIGDGTRTRRATPAKVAGGHAWLQLTSGYAHTCGITTDYRAWCWGYNRFGQLGDGTKTDRLQPTEVKGGLRFKQMQAGFQHTCAATTDGKAYCWGHAAIGDGTTTYTRLRPTAVLGDRNFDNVTADGGHSCGATVSGRSWCWGFNGAGQLGDGTNTPRIKPVQVVGGLDLTTVNAGFGSTCAVATDHRAWCWGDNFYGQLGDGTGVSRLVPTPVAGPAS